MAVTGAQDPEKAMPMVGPALKQSNMYSHGGVLYLSCQASDQLSGQQRSTYAGTKHVATLGHY